MGQLDQETLQKLLFQAKLRLTEQEREYIASDIKQIVGYFKKLEEVDTTDTMPLFSVRELQNVFRPDEAEDKARSTEDFLSNAPETQGDFLTVPKIVS